MNPTGSWEHQDLPSPTLCPLNFSAWPPPAAFPLAALTQGRARGFPPAIGLPAFISFGVCQ